jgi:hypothetical protein
MAEKLMKRHQRNGGDTLGERQDKAQTAVPHGKTTTYTWPSTEHARGTARTLQPRVLPATTCERSDVRRACGLFSMMKRAPRASITLPACCSLYAALTRTRVCNATAARRVSRTADKTSATE